MNLPRTRTTATKSILLFSPLVTLCVLLSYTDWIIKGCSCSALCVWMLPFLGLVLTVTLVIVAARATMVTWITVLVLLAFAGKRRRVLAQHGRKITADVAIHLFRILLKERGLVAVVCATIVSLMAMVRLREAE
ncbi:hypothetical protein I3843_11G020100 [Carya illinoinensis]|nr:hypothetical protein I3843_11G020100 [Carya illinoinensis]